MREIRELIAVSMLGEGQNMLILSLVCAGLESFLQVHLAEYFAGGRFSCCLAIYPELVRCICHLISKFRHT